MTLTLEAKHQKFNRGRTSGYRRCLCTYTVDQILLGCKRYVDSYNNILR